MDKKQLLCIGHITHDRIVTPSQPQGIDSAGGTVYYAAWALHHLPSNVSFGVVTNVGADLASEVSRMRTAGISVDFRPCPTSVYFENRYEQNMDTRHQRVRSKAAPFTIAQLLHYEADVFHLGSLLQDDFAPEVVEHLASKGRVAMDVQGYLREVRGEQVFACDWADKRRVLAATHTLKLNEMEAEVLTGEHDLRQAARTIASWGVREVLLTLGSLGSLILADGQFHEMPAYPAHQAVDATGCGDTFTAVYLYARALSAPIADAARMASAACTLKLAHTGPFSGTIDDIRQVIG